MTRLLAFAAGVLAAGCAMSPASAPSPARLLALGDSYTVGEGVPTAQTWPFVVAAELRAAGTAVADPTVVAQTGWTTDELDAAITAREPALDPPYDAVTLLVGVNDQYRGRPADGYRAPFRALLARAVGFAGGDAGRVVVVSIPDWGVTPFAAGRDRVRIAAEIDAYNAVAQAEATGAGAAWVDVTAVSRRWPDETAADGLHPSAAAYARWAEAVAPAVRAALAR